LDIVDILEEKHSAFKPYNRPVFEDMIRRIRKGEATGIIAWHPDRLSRNEIDASTITYLVRTEVIHDLKFASYNFDNSPEGIMMLQLALSQSQYFSSKLGKDVKRGLQKKISLGWFPGVAPEGYLNDVRLEKGNRTIILDEKRAILLRKAFELMLTGLYTGQQVLDILNKEWGYKMRIRKSTGGGELIRSTWYKMLSSPFYAGIIVYNGIESPGKHTPLISLDEFNRIQEILGPRGCKRKPKKYDFTYSGMFKCGNCGCGVTAEYKTKYLQIKKEMKRYNYYHCTHKKRELNCKQGSVEEKEITADIAERLKRLEIHPILLDWALEYLEKQKGVEEKENKIIKVNKKDKTKELTAQLSELTKMRFRNLIDDKLFLQEKEALKKELDQLNETSEDSKGHDEIIELTKETFIFCAHALKTFESGDKLKKKEILLNLGSNQTIIDKKVLILQHKWIAPIYDNALFFNTEIVRLEPPILGLNKRKNDAFASLNLAWLDGSGSNRRPIGYTLPLITKRSGLYYHPRLNRV